jgi:type IV secretory pathway VirB4 component
MINVEPTADHPMPFDMSDEEPKTHKDAVSIAVNTVDLMEELGPSIDFQNSDLFAAQDLITGAEKKSKPATTTVLAQAKAAQVLIREFDFQAFADVHQARNFVTNKLIQLADCGDIKVELKALELLGKHSDIGLFTERSEITVHHTTSESLEKSIKERIKRLLNSDITDVTPLDDLDAQLGPPTEQESTPQSEDSIE